LLGCALATLFFGLYQDPLAELAAAGAASLK
jgi:hypothetical protein